MAIDAPYIVKAGILLCLLPYVQSALTSSETFKPHKKMEMLKIFLRIAIKYYSNKDFRFALHIDNIGMTEYNLISSGLFSYTPEVERIVLHYSETMRYIRRPIGFHFINIVLLHQPTNFRSYIEIPGNVLAHDKAMFAISKSSLEQEDSMNVGAFWRKNSNLSRFSNIGFVVPTDLGVELYETCYFCGSMAGLLRLMGIWNFTIRNEEESFNDIGAKFLANSFKDLNGHKFRVVFIPFPPIIWCESSIVSQSKEEVCLVAASGPEGKLLEAVSRNLNFTTRLVNFRSTKESKVTMDANIGPWDIMINKLSESVADMAVGAISVTLPRTLLVSFTQMFNREPHNFAYLHFDKSAIGVTGPFSPALWISLSIAWIFTSIILCMFGRSRSPYYLSGGILATGAMLLGQGSSTPAQLIRTRSSRILLLSWCWFSFIIITVYGSKLVSSLINPAPPDDPSQLEDLLAKKYQIITSRSSIFAVRDLLNSSDPVYRAAGQKMKMYETFEETVKVFARSLNGGSRIAVLGEITNVRWGLTSVLPLDTKEQTKPRLRLGNSEILASGHAWALHSDHLALVPSLNKEISSVLASGLPHHWIQQSVREDNSPIPYGNTKSLQEPRSSQPLPLQLFITSLIIWVVGLLVGLIVFGIELFWSLRHHESYMQM